MDSVDKATRSKIMSRVRQKNTGLELSLRKSMHQIGLRYLLHDKRLPGTPDVVFPRFKAVLFIHGCFWHRHGCKTTTTPKSNFDYWQKKFERNVERDKHNLKLLLANGWRVGIVWGCSLKGKPADIMIVAKTIHEWLHTENKNSNIPYCNEYLA